MFSEKIGLDGEVVKKKVRLVAKGYTEIWGEDYWNTYSPTLGCDSLLSLLAYAAAQDLKIHQMDAIAAYLNSDLTEEIYISPPKGIPICSGKVWQLKKALYGLKQVGLEWYHTLQSHIKSVRYVQSGYDPCLYVRDSDHFTVVYVDDLLVFGTKQRIAKEKKELARNFEMHDLGKARWFLAMEITCDRVARTITIGQQQYIWKILERFGLENSWSVSTPMAINIKLPKLETPEVDQHLYQLMLSSLMYAVIGTQPDIMFTMHYLSQFLVAPGLEHIAALKCIYQYLNGTRDLRMTFHGNQIRDNIIGFMDSDWAGNANSWRSVSRYAFIFCGTAVAWSAKKQPTIALLSTEVEYMALTHASKESTFLEHLYKNVGIPISPPIFLLVDNQSTIALTENPIFHARSKHIEVQHHWVCEKIEGGSIELEYVPMVDQVANIFMKPLMAEKFRRFCGALGLVPVKPH